MHSLDQTRVNLFFWTTSEKEQLLASNNAASFIKKAIQLKKPLLNISKISKICGYKSRSYLRDVLAMKKNMTLVLAHKLIESLNLESPEAKYFLRLCSNDYESCRLSSTLIKNTERTTNTIVTKFDNSFDLGFKNYFVPIVFAALGNTKKGVSLGTIQKRTNLELETISNTLNKLTDIKLVTSKGRLYFPNLDHAKGKGLGSKSFFKNYFLKCLEETHRTARNNMDIESDLFFSSHILVKKENVADLKKALREVLFQFVDDHLEGDGDLVKNLVCSFN